MQTSSAVHPSVSVAVEQLPPWWLGVESPGSSFGDFFTDGEGQKQKREMLAPLCGREEGGNSCLGLPAAPSLQLQPGL